MTGLPQDHRSPDPSVRRWRRPAAESFAVLANGNVVVLYYDPPSLESAGAFMTFVIGVKSTTGIVLVADSRKSAVLDRSLILEGDDACKLYQLGPYGIALSGFAAMANDILDHLRKVDAFETCPDIKEASWRAQGFLNSEFQARFGGAQAPWPVSSTILLAGYDGKTPRIFVLQSNDGFYPVEAPPAAIGSNRALSVAILMSRLLLEPNQMPTLEQAKVFGVTVVRVADERDLTVGGPIRMAVVTPDGYSDASDQVASILASSDALRQRIARVLIRKGQDG
jgi:20S proteasome alpha/beta subunit